MQSIAEILARELEKPLAHVQNVIDLLDEGNTIPFIARYRKELHGSMDDTALRTLEDRLNYLRNLAQRREEVKNAIDGQGKLTQELSAAIDNAATLAEVEDLYRPYKQKRRTRATVAREKGLEPLAQLLLAQGRDCPDPETAAAGFLDPEKGVETLADALQGANDIVAELLSDDAAIRKTLRELLRQAQTAPEEELPEALFRYHRGVVFLGGNTITPLLFNAFKKVNLEFWSGYIRSVGREESLRTLARFTDLIAAGQGDEAAQLLDDGLRRFVTTL